MRRIFRFGVVLSLSLLLFSAALTAWKWHRGIEFYGFVIDPAGRPVGGAVVTYGYYRKTTIDLWDGRHDVKQATATTGVDGRFRLSGRLAYVSIRRVEKGRAGWSNYGTRREYYLDPEPSAKISPFRPREDQPEVFALSDSFFGP